MKVKIKSFNGELPSCFSEDVVYIVDNTEDLDGVGLMVMMMKSIIF